ncbi:MAG: hypothetical protein CSA32_03865 [Desulfobulbus propionicus]|nr:MAG: hypothetical protein CSA32_03865 [Desulfobulbus propionicus]
MLFFFNGDVFFDKGTFNGWPLNKCSYIARTKMKKFVIANSKHRAEGKIFTGSGYVIFFPSERIKTIIGEKIDAKRQLPVTIIVENQKWSISLAPMLSEYFIISIRSIGIAGVVKAIK